MAISVRQRAERVSNLGHKTSARRMFIRVVIISVDVIHSSVSVHARILCTSAGCEDGRAVKVIKDVKKRFPRNETRRRSNAVKMSQFVCVV